MRRDCMARELTVEVIVGVFMVMIFLGLGYFTIILSRENWFGPKRTLEVVFGDVMGLREGDNVVVRGMTIGEVKKLSLAEDGVHVDAMLFKALRVREDYRMLIVSTSILGGRSLMIDQGSMAAKALPPDTVYRGEDPYDLMADAAEVVNAVKRGIIEGGVIENLRSSANQIDEMITRVNLGKGTLGRLLSEDDTLYTDFATAVAALNSVAQRLEKGEGTLGRLFSADDTLYRDVAQLASSLKNISSRLEKGEGTVGRLLSGDDQAYQDLAAALHSLRQVTEGLEKGEGVLGKLTSQDAALYDDVAATAASLRRITARIEEGEGTIGRLVEDEALYDQAKEVVTEVRAAVDDFRETTPLTTFTSIFFGVF